MRLNPTWPWNEGHLVQERKHLQIQNGLKERMMEALHNLVWMDEMLKSEYQNFLEKMAHHSI
jgi:hypothetical protein